MLLNAELSKYRSRTQRKFFLSQNISSWKGPIRIIKSNLPVSNSLVVVVRHLSFRGEFQPDKHTCDRSAQFVVTVCWVSLYGIRST